ncbi:MAG TPA: sensor histidine kinase N-terminal domain-containing protein [Dokdonella sp.]|nr:sensor histidine kinase N-terminal domain-containing protein [Dokdonella sp.]
MNAVIRQPVASASAAGKPVRPARRRRWLAARGRPSLHRRLLKFLLAPLLLALIVDALLIYLAALAYSNHVHDRDLVEEANALAGIMASEDSPGPLSHQARLLLEYDSEQRDFFRVASSSAGVLAENGRLDPLPPRVQPGQAAVLSDAVIGHLAVRVATVAVPSRRGDGEILWVSMAETLHDRHRKAREILVIATPMLGLLIVVVLGLVWLGVGHGLRLIERLTARLAAQPDGIVCISDADVPHELLPLTRTIDELFARLQRVLAVQERFIADAAHQLRTPLAGLSLHVQRALANPRGAALEDALRHIDELSRRAARTSGQLLALSRADSRDLQSGAAGCFDLTATVADVITQRVDEAISADIDLGYEGITTALMIDGDAGLLQDLLDNLIDNALRYAGAGSSITVSLRTATRGAVLVVEDDGPGIADAYLPRLGERFFRVPGQALPGTGLGLAIVRQIAGHFSGELHFLHGRNHRGLRVEIILPRPKGS